MTQQEQPIKKKKDFDFFFVIGLLLLGTLAYVDIWYADWSGMGDTWCHMGIFGAIVLHAFMLTALYISLAEWHDDDFTVMRRWFCAFAFACILYIGAFRASKNERQSVTDDSNQAKQEQSK